jgi:hypothetical protein
MRGKGKTNYVKDKLLEQKITPAYIVDIRNEFRHIPAFVSLKHFVYWLQDKRDSKYVKWPDNNDYYLDGQYRFVFSSEAEWITLFQLMKDFRNCTIVIDEADAIFTVEHFKRKLRDVFLGSRNNNVSMIFLGKRPSLIPIIVRSQADRFVIFAVEEQWDVQYLTSRLRQTFPKDVFKLERGEAIEWESGEKPRLVTFDKFKGD